MQLLIIYTKTGFHLGECYKNNANQIKQKQIRLKSNVAHLVGGAMTSSFAYLGIS